MPEPHHTPETPSRTERYPTLSQHHPGSGTTSKNDLSHRYHRRKSPSFLRSGITHPSHRAGPDLDVWRLEDPTRHGRQHDAFFHLPRRDHLPGFVLLLARAVPRHIGDERTGAVLCTFWTRHKELLRSTVSLMSFFFSSDSVVLSGPFSTNTFFISHDAVWPGRNYISQSRPSSPASTSNCTTLGLKKSNSGAMGTCPS